MKSILLRTAMVLGLGIAPGALFAQEQTAPDAGATGQTECQPGDPACPPAGGQATGESGASGQVQGQTGTEGQVETEGQAQTEGQVETEGQAQTEGQAPAEGQAQTEGQVETEGQAQTEGQAPAEGQAQTEGQAETEGQAATEGQDVDSDATAAIGDVNITTEQKTEIKQVITNEVNVEPVDVDIDVSVGVAVPRTVRLHKLPPRIVRLVPAYEDYLFFVLVDGRIVIVEPDTLKIVIIIA